MLCSLARCFLSQCLSPPRSTNGYQQIVRETCSSYLQWTSIPSSGKAIVLVVLCYKATTDLKSEECLLLLYYKKNRVKRLRDKPSRLEERLQPLILSSDSFPLYLQGNYAPSYLACPETYNWIPIEQCRPKLDLNKYSRLDDPDEGKNCTKFEETNQILKKETTV